RNPIGQTDSSFSCSSTSAPFLLISQSNIILVHTQGDLLKPNLRNVITVTSENHQRHKPVPSNTMQLTSAINLCHRAVLSTFIRDQRIVFIDDMINAYPHRH
ncbi:hypothetical protein ACOV11_24325, partial [Vibrio natriegens]